MTKIIAGTLRAKLCALKRGATPLKRAVIDYAMRYGNEDSEVKAFFKDLLEHGCVSGMVSSLIYCTDTAAFTQKHIHEILEMLEEIDEQMGQPAQMRAPYSNWLAWFGFEETARKVTNEIGIGDEI